MGLRYTHTFIGATSFASKAHEGQGIKRISNNPFLLHEMQRLHKYEMIPQQTWNR